MPRDRKRNGERVRRQVREGLRAQIEAAKEERDAVHRKMDRVDEAKQRLAHRISKLPWWKRMCLWMTR